VTPNCGLHLLFDFGVPPWHVCSNLLSLFLRFSQIMSELYWRNTVSTLMRDILLFHVIGSLVLILLRFTIIIDQPAGNPQFFRSAPLRRHMVG
jgi:hypothetical protein